MAVKRPLAILFIGNSHTFVNDVPLLVRQRAGDDGFDCRVTMIAHGGWYLEQHVREPDVRFNILHGGYDYVVLQEHAHPFGPEEKFREAAAALDRWIREAGSIPVIYECWSRKAEPEAQREMAEAHKRVAEEIDALRAPVGETWWAYAKSRPGLELYAEDGAHASPAGSEFAAGCIWEVIRSDIARRGLRLDWVDGFSVSVRMDPDGAVISANREGLLSLAGHLAALAKEAPGSHLHLDACNALEDGSSPLIIEKTE